ESCHAQALLHPRSFPTRRSSDLLRLTEPTSGTIAWRGRPIEKLSPGQMRPYRRELQAVFQDPYSSLNPRMRAAEIVAEPLRNFRSEEHTSELQSRENLVCRLLLE